MIFRKVALERLSSPEQLDQLLQVTHPKGWLALTAVGAILAAAITWGFVGTIPTEAQGEGILLRQGGVSDLVTLGQGQVEEVRLAVGDEVRKGQVVATLRQDELLRRIEDDRSRLADLREEYRDLERYAEEQRRLREQGLEQRRANLRRTIDTLERDLEILRERLEAERGLLDEGLVTRQTLLATEQEVNGKRDELAAAHLELDGLELDRLEQDQSLDQQLETRRAEIRDRLLEIGELEARLEENARIVSPYDGRVLEIVVDRGDVVASGSPVLTMEVIAEELMAVLFVPAELGKRIEAGMEARVSPSTVKREEHGFLRGEVTWVSEFPSTSRGMVRLLANEALVTRLMEQGPPIQVDVVLRRDPSTPTGFAWSSSRGPDLEISSGTLASGSVIVEQSRPVDLVIPKIRSSVGMSK